MGWEITLQDIVLWSGEPEESYRHHSPGWNASPRSAFQSVHRVKNSFVITRASQAGVHSVIWEAGQKLGGNDISGAWLSRGTLPQGGAGRLTLSQSNRTTHPVVRTHGEYCRGVCVQ